MSLEPLLAASLAIRIHAFAAMAAFVLGAVQIAAPKGTIPHRAFGWAWVALMVIVAGSSFLIHSIRTWGDWSPIHILSIVTLLALPGAVLHARRHRVAAHQRAMLILFVAALGIAGAFTLAPGRIMHEVVFGTAAVPGA